MKKLWILCMISITIILLTTACGGSDGRASRGVVNALQDSRERGLPLLRDIPNIETDTGNRTRQLNGLFHDVDMGLSFGVSFTVTPQGDMTIRNVRDLEANPSHDIAQSMLIALANQYDMSALDSITFELSKGSNQAAYRFNFPELTWETLPNN